MRLLPLFRRALELLAEQGHIPASEDDVMDLMARTSNEEQAVIVAGPHALYAKCSKGRTDPLPILPGEGVEEVRALGQIAIACLFQAIRQKDTTP